MLSKGNCQLNTQTENIFLLDNDKVLEEEEIKYKRLREILKRKKTSAVIIVTFLLLRFALFRKVMLIADQFGETRVTYYVTSFVSVTRTHAVDYLICEIKTFIFLYSYNSIVRQP